MNHITLYYQQGASDKIYHASVEPQNGGYVVRFSYGRRGATLQTGTKTPAPVAAEEARRVYDKLVREKLAKGYTPGEAGTPYQHTDKSAESTGILPQLLNPISPEEAAGLISDPGWAMQEKFDGRRMLVRKTDDGIEGLNRNGLIVALPTTVASAVEEIPGTFVLDGECLGDTLVAFDLLERHGTDQKLQPYRARLTSLMQFVPGHGSHLCSTDTAVEITDKAELYGKLKADNREGVVFKKWTSPYTAGRPASGGNALKCKFYESASFVVGGLNPRRSVSLTLFRDRKAISAGNVTIPPNYPVPREGAVVEVRYLYAFPESGCIYQPVYLGVRDDVAPHACQSSQLKFKPAGGIP